eukprot:TRINITY_DN7761_c0_g1_i1.p2 TRINITY_DN7761_c0_g1~~TRINITY_DN7761_c0_g1_i1.p2  ORF type:complete len:198 (-),score=45.59 TRINITY_DN7761_c0_g1_i1:489-1082(-)
MREEEDNSRKQITLRDNQGTTTTAQQISTQEREVAREVIARVTENTLEIEQLWEAVATVGQTQNDQWVYSRLNTEQATQAQLKAHLETTQLELKSKLRQLKAEKKFSNWDNNVDQQSLKNKINKYRQKYEETNAELDRVEKEMAKRRSEMENIYNTSATRMVQWAKDKRTIRATPFPTETNNSITNQGRFSQSQWTQ